MDLLGRYGGQNAEWIGQGLVTLDDPRPRAAGRSPAFATGYFASYSAGDFGASGAIVPGLRANSDSSTPFPQPDSDKQAHRAMTARVRGWDEYPITR